MRREVSATRRSPRAGIVLAAVLAAATAWAAPARAAIVGNPDMNYDHTDFGTGCSTAVVCIWMQTKIPGELTRAPYSGVITKWRMAQPDPEEGSLVVMRKAKHGKFTAVRVSAVEETPGAGTYSYDTHLKIKKGDYIALYSGSAMGQTSPNSQLKLFDAQLALGQPTKPDVTLPDTYFYNATLKR